MVSYGALDVCKFDCFSLVVRSGTVSEGNWQTMKMVVTDPPKKVSFFNVSIHIGQFYKKPFCSQPR